MDDMQRRIERGDVDRETVDAIDVWLPSLKHVLTWQAICDIALDRAGKLGEETEK